jgi:prevent-host-death family protein
MEFFRSQDMQRQAAALQEAAMKEPVIITYHDRPRFVLMSMQEYDRLRGRLGKNARIVELPESALRQIERLGKDEDKPKAKLKKTVSHGSRS